MRPSLRDHPIGTPVRHASLKTGTTTATNWTTALQVPASAEDLQLPRASPSRRCERAAFEHSETTGVLSRPYRRPVGGLGRHGMPVGCQNWRRSV
jgi:hypothetical protein